MTIIPKTKEQLAAEVPSGGVRFERSTKVIALRTGYSDSIREEGDIFYVKAGTIAGPNCWFIPVSDGTATTVETDALEDMTVAQLKIALAEKGIDFAGISKKNDLIALLTQDDADNGEDLA